MSGYVPTLLEVRASVDGTLTYFDLINGGNGLFLDEWEPSVVQEKGGGVFSDSPMSDGKSLVFERWDNAIENIKVKAKAQTGNAISLDLQDLFHLFQMAKAYSKTAWQTNPVYLAMQPAGQTNEQYAPIIIGRVPNLSNPVRQPWYKAFARGGAAIDNLPIIIERGHWLENVPGVGTAIEAIATNTFNSRVYGNVDDSEVDEPTTADAVFVANKRNEANLTHIYRDDGGVFSSNLIDTIPATLLPATPAVNDAAYFGIQTSVSNSGPFSNLVFDIGTAGSGYVAVWEYWNGSAWTSLQPYDPSAGLKTSGVQCTAWYVQSGWAATAVNSITAYWVRLRVSSITTPTPPTQQNRRAYSTTWPYAEIRSDQIDGDIPALGKLIAQLRSSNTQSITLIDIPASGVLIGLRRTSRGDGFTAYLNISNEQNPSGVSVSLGTASAFITDVQTPTGVVGRWSSSGGDNSIVTVSLDSTLATDFAGRFRMMVRAKQVGGSNGDMALDVRLSIPTLATAVYVWQTDSIAMTDTDTIECVDFGEIEIPQPESGNSFETLKFYINAAKSSAGAGELRFIDLILIPVDEMSIESYHPTRTARFWGGSTAKLHVDSISKYGKVSSYLANPTTNYERERFVLSAPSGLVFPRNSTFRLWFFMTSSTVLAYPETIQSVQLERNQRYLGLRATN